MLEEAKDLEKSHRFEIQAYKKPKNIKSLRETHVPFAGSPQKHPHDPKKVVLVADPYSTSPFYYEFRLKDIAYAEELPSLVDLEGNTLTMVRIWIQKGAFGLRCTPFLVEETGPVGG
jgi:inorganic pyrophosphatase